MCLPFAAFAYMRDHASFTTARSARSKKGESNSPIQFESSRKIWPLFELLAKLSAHLLVLTLMFASAGMLGFSLKFPAA